MKTLVLGLGNPILSDDGVGIHVVREVAARSLPNWVTCTEASVGGLRLLEVLAGYERAIENARLHGVRIPMMEGR